MHGWGCAWLGCVGGMHGRGGHVWGSMHGRGCVWKGGMHGRGEAYMAAETAINVDGTHPTGMHSCCQIFLVKMSVVS